MNADVRSNSARTSFVCGRHTRVLKDVQGPIDELIAFLAVLVIV